MAKKGSAEKAVRDIRRKTRRRISAEEKIRIVIEGLRSEESIASPVERTLAVRVRWTARASTRRTPTGVPAHPRATRHEPTSPAQVRNL